jgi:hypothetical protein
VTLMASDPAPRLNDIFSKNQCSLHNELKLSSPKKINGNDLQSLHKICLWRIIKFKFSSVSWWVNHR